MNVKRILHIPGVMTDGGVETVIMNWYRNIDRTKLQFDFCVSRNYPAPIDAEITSLGGRIIYAPTIHEKKLGYFKSISSIIKQNGPYETVHIHSAHLGAFSVLACRMANIRCIIYHVHSTQNLALKGCFLQKCVEKICSCIIRRYSTARLSCSTPAGIFVYKIDDFRVIKNAIDLQRFYPYNRELIDKSKENIKLPKDVIVVGYVARFVAGKNHKLLIELISNDKKNGGNLILLLLGDGPLKDEMVRLSSVLNCTDRVYFMGKQHDTPSFYNMMDVLCVPSDFEGLPLVSIEAQACGVPCIISSGVPVEVNMEVVPFRQMKKDASVFDWIDNIYAIIKEKSSDTSKIHQGITDKGYNLAEQIKEIEKLYQVY